MPFPLASVQRDDVRVRDSSGDPICVRVHEEGQEVVVAVDSHGPPISPTVIPTLFEPFIRAAQEVARWESKEGSGLWLFIVSETAGAHGGTIFVSSVLGEGTTFSLRLPRSMPRPARTATRP